MSQRITRINGLMQRELNDILRTEFRTEASNITITEVRISPDLRDAKIFYAVFGGEVEDEKAKKFLKKVGSMLKAMLAQRVILKYTPRLRFAYDHSSERGARVTRILDAIEEDTPEGR